VTQAYADNGGRLLAAVLIASLSIVFLFWFVGALASALREVGMAGWGATIIGALTARAGVQIIIVTVYGALAWKVADDGDTGVVLALGDMAWALGVTASLPIAVVMFASAMGLVRGGIAKSWYRWLFLVGAVVELLGGTTWAQSGVWAPDGPFALFAIAVALLWMFVTSAVLLRAPEPTQVIPERMKETAVYPVLRSR
jgi:hypothetical protein